MISDEMERQAAINPLIDSPRLSVIKSAIGVSDQIPVHLRIVMDEESSNHRIRGGGGTKDTSSVHQRSGDVVGYSFAHPKANFPPRIYFRSEFSISESANTKQWQISE
jgi:hypothetical protein